MKENRQKTYRYKIEKVAPPQNVKVYNIGRKKVFPQLDSLQVGESFKVPAFHLKRTNNDKAHNLRMAIQYVENSQWKRFTTRMEGSGCRVWRIG